jgi:GNAT superfamily N-acetyltransferase
MIDALRASELAEACAILAAEGWGFSPQEIARVLSTGPGLSVAARQGATLQGLVMVARHGPLAWIGNVAVAPPFRGQGLGEALVEEALGRIDRAGIVTTKLCSVPKARTLYARLGFAEEGTMRTYAAMHERPTHRPVEASVLLEDDVFSVAALDAAHFGGDRSGLLGLWQRDYPDTGIVVRDEDELVGYAFLQPASEGSVLGPVVTDGPDPVMLETLLDAALGFRLQGNQAAVECTTHAANPWMDELLRARGFVLRTESTLMARGEPLEQDWLACAALGGLEKG